MSGDVSKKELERWLTDKFFPHERGFFLPSEGMENQEKGILKVYEKKMEKVGPE